MKRVLTNNQAGNVARNQTGMGLTCSSEKVFKQNNTSRSSGAAARRIGASSIKS